MRGGQTSLTMLQQTGVTPIEDGRNLGPATGERLRLAGIATVEELLRVGWEEAWSRMYSRFPMDAHAGFGYALYGAEHDVDWRDVPPAVKERIRGIAKRARAQRDQ